jgi:hypothetical protein
MRRALLAAVACVAPALGAQAPTVTRYTLGITVQLGADTDADSSAAQAAAEGLAAIGFQVPATVTCPTVAGFRERVLSRVAAYPSTGAGIATVRDLPPPDSTAAPRVDLRRAVERADLHPILPHRAGSDTLLATITLLATTAPARLAAIGHLECPMSPAGPGVPRP